MPREPGDTRLFLTCEHGGNLIPDRYHRLFERHQRLLASHRGWDPGALELAGKLAATLQAPLRFALVSRLLIDLNRSLDNPALLSPVTSGLTPAEHRRLVSAHYRPYRRDVQKSIAWHARRGPIVHVSVHSFTPVLKGTRRDTDIGLLFDPSRPFERSVANDWKRALQKDLPRLTIHFNRPYRGTEDGLTTHLRTVFPDRQYAGLELEVNQRFSRRAGPAWHRLTAAIADTLRSTMYGLNAP